MAMVMVRAQPPVSSSERVLGLEAVRALAIAAVIAYHLNIPGFFNAGFLGVDIFFNLSGFLITSLLLREHQTHGCITLWSFYARRFNRLFPAFAIAITGCVVLAVGWMSVAYQHRLRTDFFPAVLYLSNWWQIYSEQSYFANFGSPPLLRHLWSLAVEMQFYLAWPLLLGLALRWGGVRGALGMSLGLALASTGWMNWVFLHDETNPSRAYLGSDTHTMGLFLGAAMACIWSPLQTQSLWALENTALGTARVRVGLSILGLGAIVAMLSLWTDVNPILYQGGFLLVSLCSVLLIVVSCTGELAIGTVGKRIVHWVGTRSYSIYLWHWPLFIFWKGDTTPDTLTVVLCLVSTGVASECSYRWVELRKNFVPFTLLMLMFAASAAMLFLANDEDVQRAALQSSNTELSSKSSDSSDSSDSSGSLRVPPLPASAASAAKAKAGSKAAATKAIAPEDAMPPLPSDARILAIGDSVMLGARFRVEQAIPGILVDAQVGRQASHSVPIVNTHLEQSLNIERVVIHIGTNGYIYEKDLRKLLALLQEKGVQRVLLVNIHADRRWTKNNNELIDRISPEFPNVRIGNWSAASQDNPHYFVADGIHLSSAGISAFVQLVGTGLGVALIPPSTRPKEVKPKENKENKEVKEIKLPTKPLSKISSPALPSSDATTDITTENQDAKDTPIIKDTKETKDIKETLEE